MTKPPDIMIIEAKDAPFASRARQLHMALREHDGLLKIEVVIDHAGDGWSVYAACECESAESAQKAAQLVLDTIAAKFRTLIRVRPKAESEIDFDTKIAKHKGLTRFIVITRPGEWKDVDPAYEMVGFGRPASEAA